MVTWAKAPEFEAANAESEIVSGRELGTKGTGIVVTLADGRIFTLAIGELSKLPEGFPRWGEAVIGDSPVEAVE